MLEPFRGEFVARNDRRDPRTFRIQLPDLEKNSPAILGGRQQNKQEKNPAAGFNQVEESFSDAGT